ncbi:MAG: MaoC/PaaZ C-terminal domain-containing protein [Acidimicrobiales bacterium]
MSTPYPTSPRWSDIKEGDELPPFDLVLTASVIVAGAIASRDFMPVHHDRSFANAQGAPDIFMNILTTNGYVSRFITDWAGPEAMLEKISIRLGAPACPDDTMRFTGSVIRTERRGDQGVVEVALQGVNRFGAHVTGTAVLTLPAD